MGRDQDSAFGDAALPAGGHESADCQVQHADSGAGAAILKCALGNLWPKVKAAGEDTVRIAAAVHDEILLLVREDAAQEWAAT